MRFLTYRCLAVVAILATHTDAISADLGIRMPENLKCIGPYSVSTGVRAVLAPGDSKHVQPGETVSLCITLPEAGKIYGISCHRTEGSVNSGQTSFTCESNVSCDGPVFGTAVRSGNKVCVSFQNATDKRMSAAVGFGFFAP